MKVWRRHVEARLQKYIENAAVQNMKPGNYTILVRFIVEKDGSIHEIRALNDPGYNLATGAVEILKTGPRWSPGELNGETVRACYTQPIHFIIASDD